MGYRDGAYSGLVAVAKLILPLIAIGILSMLFIAARPNREGEPLRFVDLGLDEGAAEERLAKPDYRSVTNTGSSLRLIAESIWPAAEREDLYEGANLTGWIENEEGIAYRLTGDHGRLDEASGTSWLYGNVELHRSDGHIGQSEEVELLNDLTLLVSPGPVHIFGPLGELDADSMEVLGQPDLGTGTLTVFRGNVRVLYDPEPEE